MLLKARFVLSESMAMKGPRSLIYLYKSMILLLANINPTQDNVHYATDLKIKPLFSTEGKRNTSHRSRYMARIYILISRVS